ncbi:Cytochrome P450 [Corchorus olitorius]|uniref:Cytochrome P450 n=1 Tax=Corchorus olitorius TaxID=93759 RepID=A0A1R3I8R2_9ROSI|nr:Cytochrome P450 [Corchorus olitorius]
MDIDSMMTYLVHLVVLCVSVVVIYLVYTYKTNGAATRRNLPPGRKGLPYVGETLEYSLALRRGTPDKFIRDRSTKYSPDVFRTSLLGEDVAVFCGPAGNKFVFFGEKNKYFTYWLPDSIKKILMDPSRSNSDHNNNTSKIRSYVTDQFLNPKFLQNYVPIMDMMAKEHLDQYWSPNEQVKVFPLSKKFTFAVACRIFVSIQDQQEIEKFEKLFGVASAGILSLPIDLPGTLFNRAMKASKLIRQQLLPLVTKKKITSDLINFMTMDGMTQVEIVNNILAFLFASHDTTSTAITFIVSYLTDFPDVYEKVLEEHKEILRSREAGEALRWEDIQKMKYTWCVACEVMRLASPSNGFFREAITDFTYAGYTIPKGWKAFWSVHTTHKNPNYFPDPEKFDPSRFEGNGPAPYTYVPFGGGPRMCPGREYARLKMLTFIHNLVTKFKWEKLNPNEKISYINSPIPEEGLPIKLQPISMD